MHVIVQCSNCGVNVRPELGVATDTTLQHRECAERFGVGTHGQSITLPVDHPVRHRLPVVALPPPAATLYSDAPAG